MPKTRHGEPLRWLEDVLGDPSIWSHGECILWPYSVSGCGYGDVRVNGRNRRVHRLVCERIHGPAPDLKTDAAHDCGARVCVNPLHLRWATPAENQADRLRHGTLARGERQGSAKLSSDDVREIRRLTGAPSGMSQREIADRYGVDRTTVSGILHRRSWSWLDDD